MAQLLKNHIDTLNQSIFYCFLKKILLVYRVAPISAVQQSNPVIYIYIHTHSLSYIIVHPRKTLFSITRHWREFPVLHSRTSLLIHSKCHRLHLRPPSSRFIQLPPPSLAATGLLSMSVSLFLLCRLVHLCHILDSTCK